MMQGIEPEAKGEDIDELWRSAGGALGEGAGGRSTLDMAALEAKLFTIGRLHKAATQGDKAGGGMRGAKQSLVQSAAAQVAREELSVLVALWDSVRFAPDSEESAQVNELMANGWAAIMRMKVWLRLRLERWRQKANAAAEARRAAAADA